MGGELREVGSGKSEVADLQVAIAVDKQVSGFLHLVHLRYQVSMQDLRRVNVLHPSEDLVEEELTMFIGQLLRRLYDRGQISLHQLVDHVKIVKVVLRSWLLYRLNAHHLGVFRPLTLSCCRCRRHFNSRNVLFMNVRCSKAFSIFFIATMLFSGSVAAVSLAETTIP